MNEELRIKVTLDTEQAKKQLDDVKGRAAAAGGGGAAMGGGGIFGSFSGKLGIGAKALAASRMVTGQLGSQTRSGFGDIASEAFGGYGAQIENYLTGGMGAEARAAAAARESTMGAFAQQAGREGAVPAQAYSYRDQIYKWQLESEKGKLAIQSDPGMRQGLGSMAKEIGEAVGAKLAEAMSEVVRTANPLW